MKKFSLYITVIFLSVQTDVYSQKSSDKHNFNYAVKEDEGELNNDQQNDKVIVEMDVKANERPFRLQIFLSQPKTKQLKLAVSSTKIIESMYPAEKKGEHNGNTIPDFFIENGVLQMVTDNKNRKSRYSFQFRNGNFELINISRVSWDGKNTTSEIEINLLAGTKIEFDQELGSDKILNKRKKSVKFATLPKIKDLIFSDLENY